MARDEREPSWVTSWALPISGTCAMLDAMGAPTSSGERVALRPDDGRLERGRRSRARIREAARSLFRDVGFDKTTLRAIAARADMGASSIYRHVETKHELLILELADLQEEAWLRFRRKDDRSMPTRWRIHRFFDAQHALLAGDPDLTVIALRAISYPQGAVSRRVLALHDRSIGLLTEILQQGRKRDLEPGLDVLAAARVLFHAGLGSRISWANGLLDERSCQRTIASAVDLMLPART